MENLGLEGHPLDVEHWDLPSPVLTMTKSIPQAGSYTGAVQGGANITTAQPVTSGIEVRNTHNGF